MSRVKFHRIQPARADRGAVWRIEHNGAIVGKLQDHSGTWMAELNNGERIWGAYGSYQSARRQVIERFTRKARVTDDRAPNVS
jgi:hypothetical protein